jgi:hypothetical protein
VAYTRFAFSSPTASMGGHVGQFVADSVGSAGFVSSPANGATITWIQAPQNGRYSAQLLWGLSGSAPASRLNNVQLQVDTTVVSSLIMLAATSGVYAATVVLTVVSTNWVALNVITGDSGATYVGNILLSKLG